jgi:regulator of nucleoside diphosphate kinase
MSRTLTRDLVLTQLDAVRLGRLAAMDRNAASLTDRIDEALIVPASSIDRDLVTMNSLVRLRDLPDGESREIKLVYPAESNGSAGQVSVLSPLGERLLGARAGDRVDVTLPVGGVRSYAIEAVVWQPEAEGLIDT